VSVPTFTLVLHLPPLGVTSAPIFVLPEYTAILTHCEPAVPLTVKVDDTELLCAGDVTAKAPGLELEVVLEPDPELDPDFPPRCAFTIDRTGESGAPELPPPPQAVTMGAIPAAARKLSAFRREKLTGFILYS
jgi:hypothetical protein